MASEGPLKNSETIRYVELPRERIWKLSTPRPPPFWLTPSLVTADYDVYPRQKMSLAVVPRLNLLSTSWRKHRRHYRRTHPARTLAFVRQILMRVDISLLGYFSNRAALLRASGSFMFMFAQIDRGDTRKSGQLQK